MTDSPTPPKPRARRLKAAGIAFTPAPTTRKRHDGWTPDRQRTFLAALYASGTVATAAQSVNISTRSAYRLRNRPGAESFAAAWDKLLRESRGRALDMAMQASFTESFVPRTYRGLFTGMVTANNDRMIIAALRASDAGGRMRDGTLSRAEFDDFLSSKGHE